MARLIITGDIMPVEGNINLFEQGDVTRLFGLELVDLFQNADYRVANLEGPLTDDNMPIAKSGPALKASKKCVRAIKNMGFNAVSLANNHILDYGYEGLSSTISQLSEMEISSFGAGANISEARKPHVVVIGGMKVGIYSCAEYEFTIATDDAPGANPYDALYVYDDVYSLKREVDYLIVLYHGMKELYRYPAPYVMSRCRRFAEKGADLVLCQHSHSIGCYEEYEGSTIVYGQGDFCFCNSDIEERKTGLAIEVNLPEKTIKFIPIEKNGYTVRLSGNESILSEFSYRSEQIKESGFVEKSYNKFAEEMLDSYLMLSMGKMGLWLSRLRLKRMVGKIYSKHNCLDLLNSIRCEAHSDLFIHGLISKIQGIREEQK